MSVVVPFVGEYDLASKGDVKAKLAAALLAKNVVLDLTRASYIDSSCIAELILFNRARHERGLPPETLLIAAGPVARILEVCGLTEAFQVLQVEAALS